MDKIKVIPLLSLLCCLFIFCCIYQLSKTDCRDVAIYTVDTDSLGTKGNGIHHYTLQDFAANGWKFPLDSKFCKETKTIEPQFVICVHDRHVTNSWVSDRILKTGYYEPEMAQWFLAVKENCVGDILYLDIGANLGIHGLHAAKAGATVWAVEPQERNLQKAIHSSILSGINHDMVFLQNAVRGSRGTVWVNEKKWNNGEANVASSGSDNQEAVNAVLLTDLFKTPAIQSFPNVFLKIDTEGDECEAILASPEVFEDTAIKALVFEWLGTEKSCTADQFKMVLKLLRENGFKLVLLDKVYGTNSKLKPDDSSITDDELVEMNRGGKGTNFLWSRISLNL